MGSKKYCFEGRLWRSQDGRGDFRLVMIQSSHRFGLAASSPNLSESSLAGWAPVLGFAALTLGPFRQALRAHPANWIQTNLDPRGETKLVGLIVSFGAPPYILDQFGGFRKSSSRSLPFLSSAVIFLWSIKNIFYFISVEDEI